MSICNILWFNQLSMKDLAVVGGKNASLGEMFNHLTALGVKIPDGFATTAAAYRGFLTHNQLDKKIYAALAKLDVSDLAALKKASHTIKHWILAADFPQDFIADVKHVYTALATKQRSATFAVRSSATAEDLPTASFAGQQDSFLNISGIDNILHAIKGVYASLFNQRSIVYRVQNKFAHENVAISAGVQVMVRSDLACSGVMFTLDTETGFDKVIFINASYGLGESVVKGLVNPDEFYAYKPALQNNKFAILQREIGGKASKIIYVAPKKNAPVATATTKTVKISKAEQQQFCLTDNEVQKLAGYALLIEQHYKIPMDIEWAKDGKNGELYIVQARPETVESQQKSVKIQRYRLERTGEVIVEGHSVSQKIGQGIACIINNPKEMRKMQQGQVLVADMTDPDWEPIMKMASAIVTNRGGRTCHAAIIARELGIPAVVGCGEATTLIKNGEKITVSCAGSEIGKVYRGLLPIKIEEIDVQKMPPLPFELYLNLADPNKAFAHQFLPNYGVGLVRIEFIITSMIGIHPKAILQLKELKPVLRQKILARTVAYSNPQEFYIERLREGIATIAAAFYPKHVIVRFSDFKSNEYANLLGGDLYEPKEENPMIGFRGTGRYISPLFADCFALECEAVKRVRNEMGLTNLEIMLPFLRTLTEAQKVTEVLAKNGLRRGENGLRIIMMCEIPSNAVLAEEFLEYFDGFSIGSNDLTQLTLGIDRDSALLAAGFDERDPAVKKLIHQAIVGCRKQNKYIGICGQGPSDYPDFAKWLMQEGITGASLNSDTIVETWLYLAKYGGRS